MSREFHSPGVYINEIDKSYYESPKSKSIDITLLGPSIRGPINTPTKVETIKDFTDIFGDPIGNAGMCATMCLNLASTVKFCRISNENISSKKVLIPGEKISESSEDVSEAITFTNSEVGDFDGEVWTIDISSVVPSNKSLFNILFKKGNTVVYDSSNNEPLDLSSDNFSDTLSNICTTCGLESPIINNITYLTDGQYTFSSGSSTTKKSVSIPGVKVTSSSITVDDAITLEYNEKGTIDSKVWKSVVSNSTGTSFDLSIYSGDTNLFSRSGISLDSSSGDYIGLISIDNFTISTNLIISETSYVNNIPEGTYYFTLGNNGWSEDIGDSSYISDSILEGLDSVGDREIVPTDIIAAPDLHSIEYLKKLVYLSDSRKDSVSILDLPSSLDEEQAVNFVSDIDSSFAATYYPWVTVYNSYTDSNQVVPPSVAVLTAMMREYLTYNRWVSPAGEPRFDLTELVSYEKVLTISSRDVLYSGRVNPLCNYKNLGNTALGQRTLQKIHTSLDRINVRFLINYIKTNVEVISSSYLFSSIDQITMDSWSLEVSKFLDSIKNQGGLYDYKVLMNWNTVTTSDLNNNIMPGIIQVKPTRVAEFIPIDVVVLNRDSEFE